MESSVCRVCLGTGEDLVNIFEDSVGFGVSIAGMISKCIGLKVERGDRLPENICPPCLQGVKDAIEDLLEKEVCKEPDTEGSIINLDATEIKEELVDDLREKEFQCQVKNEPLEEDVFEKEYNPIPESDSDPCEIQMKIEIEEYDWQGLKECDDDYESANDNDENTSLHKCSCCLKTFTSKSALRYHFKKHSRGRPFKCTQCSKKFTHNCYLKRHLQTHTGTGESPFKCSLCPKTFPFNSVLQSHFRKHSGERPFNCTHCSKCFQTLGHLQAHVVSHTGERKFSCMRTHTGERPYECSLCSKTFIQKTALNNHLRTHTGEKPFKCSHCSRTFARNSSLELHLRTHTGEQPYKCTQCSKNFAQLSHLNVHLRTHTGERPYKCSICPKSYSHQVRLKGHLLSHNSVLKSGTFHEQTVFL
ncbi:gastrula zinc finger protein XlCGF57.1-like [Drosophila subpulchrella]|uniref:gastrula zinc finger protein XlCGF57.1-like n=1 Tax=Drosophila subpulchrella TaxID=1486046 RepID=UPI0018A15E3C|nr:gastrula zinc finger protein XlCGF57.1-like [Drosophila subpulchrella]